MKPACIVCVVLAIAVAIPVIAQQRPAVRTDVFIDMTKMQPVEPRAVTRIKSIDFSPWMIPSQGRSHKKKDMVVLSLFADSSQILRRGRPLELIPDRDLGK
jgi:hypothetical protein